MTPKEFYESNKDRFLDEAIQLLQIPSISTDPAYASDVAKAAAWVEEKLKLIGLEKVEKIVVKNGNPVVTGQKIFDPALPTLLLYGHYDVQPPGDLNEWKSDPFSPEIRDGALYARGATDDKAQFLSNIAALEYYIQKQEKKTWNIKVMVEGEEEIGGPSIEALIGDDQYVDAVKADYAYISDGPWATKDTPSIEYALRGLVYFDLELQTATSEAHSGLYGNAIMNAGNLAGYVIYKLKDILANRLRIPGIYKSMRKLSQEEIDQINAGSMSWDQVKETSSAFVVTPYARRRDAFSPAVLTGTRPSLDVHGISCGFTQKSQMKTVIPASALVKFSIRLVPHLSPETVTRSVEKYLARIIPKGVTYTLTPLNSSKAYITDPKDEQIEKLFTAYEQGFGKRPHLAPSGGSVGLVTTLAEKYGMKSLLASYGLPDDRLHGPNEKYDLSQFEGGFFTLCHFLGNS